MSLMIDSKTLGVEATEQAASRLPVEQPPPRPVRTRRSRVGSMVKVSMITGVGCVGALFAAEHLGPPEWKPSTMIGAFDRVPVRGVRSVSRSGRRVIVSGLAGERVRLRVQTG